MLAEKIESVSASLAEMAGRVDEENWNKLRRIRRELQDAAQIAANMEKTFYVPGPDPAGAQDAE